MRRRRNPTARRRPVTSDSPNFLVITTDQHRADHLGCYGARILSTPNIDSLAENGTRFENAYVASPVCMPNRASIATGRMPSLHGVRHNGLNLKIGSVTFADLLRRAGWRTSLSGKAHFQCITRTPGAMSKSDGSTDVLEAVAYPAGRYDQENGLYWRDGRERHLDKPYYGFEEVDLAVGHGDCVAGDYERWVKSQGADLNQLSGPQNARPGFSSPAPQAWRTAVPEELYSTRYIEARTIERLREYAAGGSKFCHWMSYCDPHHPFTPPGKYWNMYHPADVDLPASFHDPTDTFSSVLRSQRQKGLANLNGTSAVAVNESELRSAIALTYGMVALIDDSVGRVLEQLDSLGLSSNTIVVFASDHGDLMGDFGLIFKGPYHFRGLIRMPLIWYDPRRPGGSVRKEPVSAIDIPATILQTADVAPFNGIQGVPFKDAAGRTCANRDCVIIEDEVQSAMPGCQTRGRVRSLFSKGWRLTIYDGISEGVLFNLNEDPNEFRNLWGEPEHAGVRGALVERLVREMIAHSETSPLPRFAA